MAKEVRLAEVPCPICGSEKRAENLRSPDHAGTVAGEFTVVRCLSCGLGYLCPRPVPEDLPLCYASDYGPHRDSVSGRRRKLRLLDRLVLKHAFGWPFRRPPPGQAHRGSALPRLLLAPFTRRFAAYKKNLRFFPFEGRGRLLDLGCGSGGYLALLARGGWDVKGVEIDPVAAARARDILDEPLPGIEVHTGSIQDAPFPDHSFDVVVMSHVLEHVEDPNEVLDRVRELLVPGGLLVLSVPLSDGYAATRLGNRWYYLELPRHLLHFTRERLLGYLPERGFDIERVRDDPAGDGWRWTFKTAPSELRAEPWLADLARMKRHRHRFSAELARRGQSSFVVVHARSRAP